ncbi:MAG: alpha/beta hydrolase [Sphingomonadaceae bacterium]|nr:alpha/beta hydrolase [Sphingomonadaceae bacterium]
MKATEFVFVHGGGQGSWIWDETIAAMKLQSDVAVKCLALDVPGCGTKRGRDTAGLSFDAIIEELAGDMDHAGVSDAVLVGHSQAGTVLPGLLKLRPRLIARAVYVSCLAPLPGHTVSDTTGEIFAAAPDAEVSRAFANPEIEPREKFRLTFCNDMTRDEADAFLDKLMKDRWPDAAISHKDWSYDHLGEIPATFVQCMRDAILPPAWQHIYAERFRCEKTVHVDAAHQVQNTQPHALAEVLLAQSGR